MKEKLKIYGGASDLPGSSGNGGLPRAWSVPTIPSRQLHALFAVAQSGSYTRAGAALNTSQSAVTHAIQALERNLGVKLVILVSNRTRLTRSGLKTLHHAKRILIEMHEIRAHADRVMQNERRAIRARLLTNEKVA